MRLPTTVFVLVALVQTMKLVNSDSMFTLTVEPANVTRALTTNVTITCQPKDPENRAGTYFVIYHSPNGDGSWIRLGIIHRVQEKAESAYKSLEVTVGVRYLQVRWPVATADTFGTYRCFVGGLEWEDEQPSEYVLKETRISAQELLQYILKNDRQASNQHKADLDRLKERLARLEKSFEELSAKIDQLSTRIENDGYAVIIP